MDTSRLKRFAPDCRAELMEQVEVKLDYVLSAKTPDLAAQETLLNDLRRVLESEGREALIERVAYTWFNRFAAFRYLDAHGWHPFRVRVITAPAEGDVLPELLQRVRKGVVPEELEDFVPASRINDLLDGNLSSSNPQAEVQRLLVIGVSQYYAKLLPNLFDKIDAFTELLLPDDLLTEHSVVHGFVSEISDEDCAEVEILGWLYQFYISEKKDEVMARKKAVPSEDIPAVTQLFTPHWIVRYLVENSLGRLWLRSRPNSRLREHMPYYVEDPEGQTPADSLTVETPEEIRLLDPACGSGHMLTYAFDLLVKIYEEEGHAPSEIPEKILTHNLFGLEICPRAAQLAQFALVCKAREQSRTAFRRPVQPQVMCLRSVVLTPDEMQAWSAATGVKLGTDELSQLHQFRENTETFGALIQPVLDGEKLAALAAKIGEQAPAGDLLVQNTHRKLRLILGQAEMLSQRYQVVVANPPYMGNKGMNSDVKEFLKLIFPAYKADLFSAFIARSLSLAVREGFLGFMSPFVWMFISAYEKLRKRLIADTTPLTLVQLEYSGFEGATVPICTFALQNVGNSDYLGGYIRLSQFRGANVQSEKTLEAISNPDCSWFYRAAGRDFERISGSPFCFWLSKREIEILGNEVTFKDQVPVEVGLQTSDNDRFLRRWFEVEERLTKFPESDEDPASQKWFPLEKGGDFRKWAGNSEYVVNWAKEGAEIKEFIAERYPYLKGNVDYVVKDRGYFFQPGVSWNKITSGQFSTRANGSGFIFSDAGMKVICSSESQSAIISSYLNSVVVQRFLSAFSQTLNCEKGSIEKLPFPAPKTDGKATDIGQKAIGISRIDWDNFETSWDFRDLPLLRPGDWEVEPGQQAGGAWKGRTLAESWDHYASYCAAAIRRMQELETENNRLWIDAYGLQDELTPEVPEDEITLARADARKDMAAFLSYAVGCMMGRYSLDHPSLILADAGDTVEQYFEKVGKSAEELTFAPDDDAIVPITEDEWFPDDAASRVRDFLRATFGPETLEQNLTFLEDSLGKSLRKYFTANTGGFYADHVKTYKKRPIYWLFESPKKHFRALVYLHRYTKDTVNILLTGYLREFRHKLVHRESELQAKIEAETATTADRNKLKKTKEAIKDVEEYERDILPLAQQRLEIDLDDGVKANYPKFGKALAKVTGLS